MKKGTKKKKTAIPKEQLPEPTIREIRLRTFTLTYTLCRKNNKGTYAHVHRDCTVVVTTPPSTTIENVESFLRENEGFFIRAFERVDRRKDPVYRYENGEKIRLFDEERTIYFAEGTGEIVDDGRSLLFYVKDASSDELRKKAVETFLQKRCETKMLATCEEAEPKFTRFGIPHPIYKFRYMQSRWGVCYGTQRRITFSYRLIHHPYAYAEYVVYHELAHFVECNHSPAFYKVLDKVLPDWKERRKILKEDKKNV